MPRTPDLAGRALDDRYELRATLGEGAFGRVYEGLDRRLARAVAVKVIKPWWAEDSAWVERFEREAQLLALLSDPGIVQIYDIGHAEEGPYYVAELVDGESLAERLSRGPLAPEQAAAITEQLCRALGSAHAQGIVHCDVKPANVLLSSTGQVKVGDFGVARLAGGTSQALSATIAGTPRYMSPEQARGRPTTPATDVYSAGVVLYEMLAGRPPFEHGSAVELGLRHVQDEPPPLSAELPPELLAIVARALAKDPRERYPDGASMASALREAGAPGASAQLLPGAQDEHRARERRGARDEHGAEDGAGVEDAAHGAAAENGATAATVVRGESPTLDLAAARAAAAARTSVIARPPATRSRAPGDGAGRAPERPRRGGRLALGAAALLLIGGGLAFLLLAGSARKTTVPELRGLPIGGISARARRTDVRPAFTSSFSSAPEGRAIAQSPAAGAHVDRGSTVRVVLSAGPPPVSVPAVVGESSAAAERQIADAGLRYGLTPVSAPGANAGEVMHQSPGAAASVPRGSTIALTVAEAPRWRELTSFTGVQNGQSVPFTIRGRRWRVLYSMAYQGTCLLIFTCFGPSAQARNLNSNVTAGEFELGEGSSKTHVFNTGPGLYRVEVSGGHDAAEWSMTVEDYY